MQIAINILVTILVFGLLIFTHELGHFLTAKWAKIKVNEFSIGMGPAIWKKQGKETLYSLRLLPIGGYVQMDGEDGDGESENAFNKKPKWKRLIVLATGAINNIIFGFILICIVFSTLSQFPTTKIDHFYEASVSNKHGLSAGDEILSINNYKVYTFSDISYACAMNGTDPMDVTVRRDGKKTVINDVSFYVINDEKLGSYFYCDFSPVLQPKTITGVISYSFKNTVSISRSIYSFFGTLFTGKANINQVSGPIGTATVIGETVSAEKGVDLTSLLLLVAMISINLGIVNLLPFPALDGGRIVLLGYEAIFRKPLPQKIEMAINAAGLILLLGLMFLITMKDIFQLF